MLISYASSGLPANNPKLEKAFNMAATNMEREFNRRKPGMFQEGLSALKREEQQLEMAYKQNMLSPADYQLAKANLLEVIEDFKNNFDGEASKVVQDILKGTIDRTLFFARAGQARSDEAIASLFLDATHSPKELSDVRRAFGDNVADIVTDFVYFKASQLDNANLELMSPSSRNVLMVGNIQQMLTFEKPFEMMRQGRVPPEEQAMIMAQLRQFISGFVTQIQKADLKDKEIVKYVVENFNNTSEFVKTNIRLQVKDDKIYAFALPVKQPQQANKPGDGEVTTNKTPPQNTPEKPVAKPTQKPKMDGGKPPMA